MGLSIHDANSADCEIEWGQWTTCSTACGPGQQSQDGKISKQPTNGGEACPSSLTRSQACEVKPCLSSIFITSGAAGSKKDMVNAQDKVVLGFNVTSLAPYDAHTFAWSGGGPGLDLKQAGGHPFWLTGTTKDQFLVINPDVLTGGANYTFVANVSNAYGASSTQKVKCKHIFYGRKYIYLTSSHTHTHTYNYIHT